MIIMKPLSLPYRFREETVRRYAEAISRIVQVYPMVSVFCPLNAETFSCRLRDSMKSLATHQWGFFPNLEGFLRAYPDISVAIREDSVIAGGKQEVRQWQKSETSKGCTALYEIPSTTAKPPPGLSVVNPSDPILESLFHLHHCRILVVPTTLVFDDDIFESSIEKWESSYDIAIERLEPRKFLVL